MTFLLSMGSVDPLATSKLFCKRDFIVTKHWGRETQVPQIRLSGYYTMPSLHVCARL